MQHLKYTMNNSMNNSNYSMNYSNCAMNNSNIATKNFEQMLHVVLHVVSPQKCYTILL